MRPSPVAITGLGAVSPHGRGVDVLWDGLLAARSTAGPIRAFDASRHAVQFACEVPDAPSPGLPKKLLRQADPFIRHALIATAEALAQAGLVRTDTDQLRAPVQGVDPDRVAVLVGSGAGGVQELEAQQARMSAGGPDRVRPYLSIAMPVNMAAGQIAIRHGLRGQAAAIVSACASGADAIGMALDLLRAGRADVVVAGGAEASITPLMMAAFDRTGALSRRNEDPAGASRPFDIERDGFVAGEGAGIVVLETPAHARARGATVLALLAGYGATDDAFDPTQPAPGGVGAVRAMRLALADAGLTPADVDHVNAHGTSTVRNDQAESAALRTVFGSAIPPVTANKSSIGHLMGAAGAVEAIASVRALQEGTIPPTASTTTLDPSCCIDLVTGGPRPAPLQVVLSSSFGFGGHNSCLVLTSPVLTGAGT